jgi:hypothetical protein
MVVQVTQTRATACEPAPFPYPIWGHRVVEDADAQRVLVFGGWGGPTRAIEGIWGLRFSRQIWERQRTTGPSPVATGFPAVAFDTTRRRVIYFGGWAPDAREPADELWTLELL